MTYYEQITTFDPDDPWKYLGALEMIEQTELDIQTVCEEVADMLIQKNRAYGDSALSPRRVFSRADSIEQLKVRIDDKLSRLGSMTGDVDAMGEDVEKDLMGYLVLLRIARIRKQRVAEANKLQNAAAVNHRTQDPLPAYEGDVARDESGRQVFVKKA